MKSFCGVIFILCFIFTFFYLKLTILQNTKISQEKRFYWFDYKICYKLCYKTKLPRKHQCNLTITGKNLNLPMSWFLLQLALINISSFHLAHLSENNVYEQWKFLSMILNDQTPHSFTFLPTLLSNQKAIVHDKKHLAKPINFYLLHILLILK